MSKLLICTPAYAGMVTSRYLQSMLATTSGMLNAGISFGLYTLETESLISRGRNKCAMYALENGYDEMFFIDSDMIWDFDSFQKILQSKYDICGGTYPVKDYPISINFNPLRDNPCFGDTREEVNFVDFAHRFADKNGEVEVMHIPTGFMRIRCSVFRTLIEQDRVKKYQSLDKGSKPHTYYEFFPVGVHEGEYESEDWAFCRIARETGFKICLNTQVVTGHTGSHHYFMSGTQK